MAPGERDPGLVYTYFTRIFKFYSFMHVLQALNFQIYDPKLVEFSRTRVGCRDRKVDIRLHGKGNLKLPWRKAGQPRHLVDVVDSDQ